MMVNKLSEEAVSVCLYLVQNFSSKWTDLCLHMRVLITVSKPFNFFIAVNDTLESVFDESGDEEEQDAIVSQVLDEIGIEISGKVSSLKKTTKPSC